jgi:hypothetical protein
MRRRSSPTQRVSGEEGTRFDIVVIQGGQPIAPFDVPGLCWPPPSGRRGPASTLSRSGGHRASHRDH